MVPHSSICAKPNRYENSEIPEILPGDRQNTHKFSSSQQYLRLSAEVNQHKHLHLCQLAQTPARARAGQTKAPSTTNRQGSPQKLSPTTGHGASCGIISLSFNEMRRKFAKRSCSAAGAVDPDGHHARTRGSSQPDPDNQASRLSTISLADTRQQRPESKQPPSQTVVCHQRPTTHAFYASQA